MPDGGAQVVGEAHASMRPPEFTGGKPPTPRRAAPDARRFNEAAGIHRRKVEDRGHARRRPAAASMRPPEFTGGKPASVSDRTDPVCIASMRPPEFTGGKKDAGV